MQKGLSNHHANLLVGDKESAKSYIGEYFKNLGISTLNNPDIFRFEMDTFGIDDARKLSNLAVHKSVTGHKIFLIISDRVTLEAQNALLKTFEDPTEDTTFFLVTREKSSIIGTLLSRMQTTTLKQNHASRNDATNFLNLSLKNRLAFAKSFSDEDKSLASFLDDLLFVAKGKKGLVDKIYYIRNIIHDSNVGARQVIEHLSLVL